MLGRLILLLVQLAAGWYAGPQVMARLTLPKLGTFDIFAYAVLFAIIVWLVGVVGAFVLKDVAQPSAGTMTVALIGALIGAGLTLFPDVTKAVSGVIKGVSPLAYPLVGAVLGYAIKR